MKITEISLEYNHQKKHLKLKNISITYNKSFKLKLKFITLTSVMSIQKRET